MKHIHIKMINNKHTVVSNIQVVINNKLIITIIH